MIAIAEPSNTRSLGDGRSASSHLLIASESDASRATTLLRSLSSIIYKLTFRQLLSFHIHTNPRGAEANAKRKLLKGDQFAFIGLQSSTFRHW